MKYLMICWMGFLATQLSVCARSNANTQKGSMTQDSTELTAKGTNAKQAIATFAGGCFWCMQPPYDKLKGVISTEVGYTGGIEKNPTYKQVAYGKTSHAEAIRVVYDPRVVSYQKLLDVFWRNIDPTAKDRQFYDVGRQYRTAIFTHGPLQHKLALASKKALERSGRFKQPIATEIVKANTFWPAEDYHQKYYKKNPAHYYRYRWGSGRDAFIKKHWGSK